MPRSIVVWLALCTFSQTLGEKCDGKVTHKYEGKETLKTEIETPYQLTVDCHTNTLFFSYSTLDTEDAFKLAYINLESKDYGTISGIPAGFATAIDRINNEVYLGGSDGIYKFDYVTKNATYLADTYATVWQMFFKDKLYYTLLKNEEAYFYKDGIYQKVPELTGTRARLLAIDNNGNIFFANSSGLFYYDKAKGNAVLMGDYNLNGFSSDVNGNLYFSTPEAIYYIKGKEVQRVVSIENLYGLAIDGDGNIIYSTEDSIFKLKHTATSCSLEKNGGN